jgi:Lon protease-like protein
VSAKPSDIRLILPIFPLPDLTFFPHTLQPLHVFEARYRAMVMDALARNRRLALVKLRPGYEATYAGKPAVHQVDGAGEIVNWERLATGRYNILVKGECRIRISGELPTDTFYRVVIARRLEEIPPPTDVSRWLASIREACARLLRALDRPADLLDSVLADDQPPGVLVDRVAAAVLPDPELRQELLETLDVARRLEQLSIALETLVNRLGDGRPTS